MCGDTQGTNIPLILLPGQVVLDAVRVYIAKSFSCSTMLLWYAEQKRDFDDFRATRHIYLNVKMPWFVCVRVWESWISWWMYKQWFKQGYHQCLWLYKWSMNVSKDGLTWVYIRAKTNWWKYSLFNINLTFHHALHLPHCLRVPDNMKFMNIVPRNNIKMSICAGAFL